MVRKTFAWIGADPDRRGLFCAVVLVAALIVMMLLVNWNSNRYDRAAREAGHEAARQGRSRDANPEKTPPRRLEWLEGWLDEKEGR